MNKFFTTQTSEIKERTFHPASSMMPSLSDKEFSRLKKSISQVGLLEPIVICKGMILDGRHRYLACKELGIEPKTTVYTGDSPWSYAFTVNIEGRSLTTIQKLELYSNPPPELGKEMGRIKRVAATQKGGRPSISRKSPKSTSNKAGVGRHQVSRAPRADDKIGELFNLTGTNIARADRLEKKAPDLYKQVLAGKKSLYAADEERKEREQRKKDDDVKMYIGVFFKEGDMKKDASKPTWSEKVYISRDSYKEISGMKTKAERLFYALASIYPDDIIKFLKDM